jgi:CheY-like chemotaxis protein
MLECHAVSMQFVALVSFTAEGKDEPSTRSHIRSDDGSDARDVDVLVVDDEPDAVESIIELLEAEGYRATGARNGQVALSMLQRGVRPALILLDLKMPVMDGWDFCAALEHESFADIPIAIVTASASLHSLPTRHTDAGFFLKPIHFDRLLRVVRNLCG